MQGQALGDAGAEEAFEEAGMSMQHGDHIRAFSFREKVDNAGGVLSFFGDKAVWNGLEQFGVHGYDLGIG